MKNLHLFCYRIFVGSDLLVNMSTHSVTIGLAIEYNSHGIAIIIIERNLHLIDKDCSSTRK